MFQDLLIHETKVVGKALEYLSDDGWLALLLNGASDGSVVLGTQGSGPQCSGT